MLFSFIAKSLVMVFSHLIRFYRIYSYIHFYFPIIFIYVCFFCSIVPEVTEFWFQRINF